MPSSAPELRGAPRGRRRRWGALLGAAVALTVTGAVALSVRLEAGDDPSPPESGASNLQYVALGDSYTAAPYVPPQEPDEPCRRSQANYPHLLAEALPALELTDVSCGAATTANMLEPQTLDEERKPPQFDALTQDTDLVTVGIGANDSELFVALVYNCFPAVTEGEQCHRDSPRGEALRPLIEEVERNVRDVIEGIEERSPEARIVVVPYPQILTGRHVCPDRATFRRRDSVYINQVMRHVSAAQVQAAITEDVEYVDVFGASRGHDICARDPWVMGSTTDTTKAASFHPLPAGQQAVARLLQELLCRDGFEC